MPIIFRALRTNFNERFDTRLTLDAVDNEGDQRALRQILNVPKTEVLYVQILTESEIPDDARGAWTGHPVLVVDPSDGSGGVL